MRTVKKIITESKETGEVKGLVEVYEELAALKMQEIRGEILNARDFFERLAALSAEVGADLGKAGLGKNGEVAVFISASTGLYGDIIDKIFVNFMEFTKKNPNAELIVLGKMGDAMMKNLAPNKKYRYFDLVNENISDEILPEVVKTLVYYQKIYLFYGKFNNIVNQETWTSSISGQVLADMQAINQAETKFLYLYEPKIEQIAKVFSEEIAGSVFGETIKEAQLAKLASRLMYLDAAIEKIDGKLENLLREKRKAVKRNIERKQLVSFAGIISR